MSALGGFSRREREILDILYQRGKASASEVRDAMDDAPSNSAVRTLLRVLEEKGHVRRRAEGLKYVYAPAVAKEKAFDPFPFPLLTMIVSLESIFLSLFIMMSQNRGTIQADRRNHLDLQINLLAEHEATKNLQLLQRICRHMGLEHEAADAEIEELTQKTAIDSLAKDLKRGLPSE